MHSFIRVTCLLFICIFSYLNISASQDSVLTYHLTKDTLVLRFYKTDLLLEQDTGYTIENILAENNNDFIKGKVTELESTSGNVWSRIKLENNSDEFLNGFLQFTTASDSIIMYTLNNGLITFKRKVGNVYTQNNNPSIGYTLQAGESKAFYIKFYNQKDIELQELVSFSAVSFYKAMDYVKSKYSWYFLFTGIILVIGIFSVLYFRIFKETEFLYFSALMFCFIIYTGLQDHIFGQYYDAIRIINYPLIGIISFSYLFLSKFLQLSFHFPKYSKSFKYFTILILINAIATIFKNPLSNLNTWTVVQNILIVIWIFAILYPTIRLARQKNPQARTLLISVTVLLLGSIIFISGGYGIIKMNPFVSNIMKVGISIFSGFLFISLFNKVSAINSEKNQMQDLDNLKSRFYANISHEFRTPLTLLIGPLNQLIEKEKNENKKTILNRAQDNAKRILALINQLLSLSKLEAGKMPMKIVKSDFIPFVKRLTLSFESLAVSKGIQLIFNSDKASNTLYFDKEKIEDIINNLLSNAFKFTTKGDEISVSVIDLKNSVNIIVKDTGQGISPEFLSQIYNRFYQAETENEDKIKGSGIGLAIVKELIDLSKATIDVKSKLGKGTTFTINIIKGKTHFTHLEIFDETEFDQIKVSTPVLTENLTVEGEKHNLYEMTLESTVLVVEDNDEIRDYIKENLKSNYKIIEASDGELGLTLAQENIPDIIISDIMMPNMDGYALTKKLKNDKRTSHIPIILLTAKASQEDKNEGLEIGADDYLTKPFDPKELHLRVNNSLARRKTTQEYITDFQQAKPVSSKLNSIDKEFIETVLNSINDNLSNIDYGVQDLSNAVGLGRSQLNRKLNALTNLSANKLIQSQRLIKALDLLKSKKGNVSEIAFETGFSSTAYFVKCFKDKYGRTPGEFL